MIETSILWKTSPNYFREEDLKQTNNMKEALSEISFSKL